MKQVCLLCERTEAVANLWCQEVYCPAEMSPYVLDYAEWLGDIEIVRPVVVLRTAVLYEATHLQETVYLKVAHPGEENKERLKREAVFLQKLQEGKGKKEIPSNLPKLLPAYAQTTVEADPYGRAMLKGQLLYFYLFEFREGFEPLRDVLSKRPQLWVNHVGWVMMSVTTAVEALHQQGLYHLSLSPDTILLKFDDDKLSIPRVLLFDFGVASDAQNVSRNWHPDFALPAYTAPELLAQGQPGSRTEVYSLGLVLYEMLVGEPAYTFKLRSDNDVVRAVQRNLRVDMNRIEDVQQVAQLANQITAPQPGARLGTISELHAQLHQIFGPIPPPKKSRWPRTDTIFLIAGAILAIAFLIAVAVSLTEFVA